MRFCRYIILIFFMLQMSIVISQEDSPETDSLYDIAWSSDGTRIAGLYRDSHVSIWLAEDLSQPILTFLIEIGETIDWIPDTSYVIIQGTQSEDGRSLRKLVTKWDSMTGELVDTLMTFQLDINFDFNPYGYIIFPNLALDSTATKSAFSFRDGIVLLTDGTSVLHLENDSPTKNVYYMEWSPDGQRLAVVYGTSDTYDIQIFDVETGELIQIIQQDFQYYISGLEWDSTGTYLATSSMRFTCCEGWSNIGLYNMESDEMFRFQPDRWWEEVEVRNSSIAWHPSEFLLAITGQDSVEIYDPSQTDAIFTIPVSEAQDIEWSPDGQQIAMLSSDGIKIWDFAPPA